MNNNNINTPLELYQPILDKVDELTSIISSVDKNTAVMANEMTHMVKHAAEADGRLERLETKVNTYEKIAFWIHGVTVTVSVFLGWAVNKFIAFMNTPIPPIKLP